MPDAKLRVNDPQGRRFVAIDKALFTIGRRTAADLQIISTDVSREHAEIVRDGDQYILRDRGSRYGTFVNGEPVTERPLAYGDRIRLGRTDAIELVFQGDEATSGLRETATDLNDLRQMAGILNGLRALGSGRVLPEVLMLVMDSALEVTKAERGFVMLANAAGELEFKVARGRGGQTLKGTSFATSEKIPREVFTTGRSRTVSDLMDGSLASVHDGTIAVGIRSVLCVPLRVVPMGQSGSDSGPDRVMGVLYLDGRERSTMTSRTTVEALEAFATQAAIAIESARLYAEEAEKTRIERDLRVAAEIQRALLAEPAYKGAFCDLAAVSVPCRTVGGDFYDYLDLASGAFAFALGDVAGKGPPAALQAAAVQTNFAALAPVSENPAAAMSKINVALLRRAVEARFATMFYGTLEANGRLSYSNAGQEPPILVQTGGRVTKLDAGGPVLGLLPVASYDGGTLMLEHGDVVVVCSDGVTEARNAAGEEYGADRLIETLSRCHGMKPEAVMDTLMASVRTFVGGAPQADDITTLVVRFVGTPA
ncbi:MAG TPA: SpoIIE family protein phosphatase [Vicinamibacterales bacterium]|nr:SpoIIE family protein phosphatase [Vicinamibacterales bacterium]